MSQQEYFQGPQFEGQEQQPLDEHIIDYPQQPYHWSTKPNTRALPKDEPASRYDEPMLQRDSQSDYQHGYHGSIGQDTYTYSQVRTPRASGRPEKEFGQTQAQAQAKRQRFSPDGDAFEHQYRPYGAYKQANNQQQWSAPWWTQPQQHRHNSMRLFWFLLLGLIFIKPLLFIIGALLAVAGVLVFALVLPFLLVAIMMVPYLLFRAATGRPLFQRRWHYSSYWRDSSNNWRGPLWW